MTEAALRTQGLSRSFGGLRAVADVSQPQAVDELARKTLDAFGGVDLLFNNAGISGGAVAIEEQSLEQWRAVVDTNLTGTFLCTQEAFKIMKAQEPDGTTTCSARSKSFTVRAATSVASRW